MKTPTQSRNRFLAKKLTKSLGTLLLSFFVFAIATAHAQTNSSFGKNRTWEEEPAAEKTDRKSTRLNSSHQIISYAVFCLKKKKEITLSRPHKASVTISS